MGAKRSKGVSQSGIRAWRQGERAFWLGCAERADDPATPAPLGFLCNQVWGSDPRAAPGRSAAIDLFRRAAERIIWFRGMPWEYSATLCAPDQGFNDERVLAACLLAAMAEAGDLDWIRTQHP